MTIVLKDAELVRVDLPLVRPFTTSFGTQTVREAVLLRVICDAGGADVDGWGECVAGAEPLYSDEWGEGAWTLIRDVLIPLAARGDTFDHIKGNRMAKATVQMALTDAALRAEGTSLAASIGGVKPRVECGVSIGIAPSAAALLEQVAGYLSEGYRRIKLKIEPGLDVERVRAVRDANPTIDLTVDANQAYTMDDIATFLALDDLDLTYIEQPFAEDDIAGHAALGKEIATPVCLDETIVSARAAREAIEAGACRVVNIKQGRLGGITEAVAAHDVCRDHGVPVWCGGMLETGIGRAANLALASLPGFTMPGDTSGSSRYFADDITQPFVMDAAGTIAVPDGPGIGVAPLDDMLATYTAKRERISW